MSETLGWNEAIQFAEAELEKVERRVRQLRTAIRQMKQLRKEGVPWPTHQSDTCRARAQEPETKQP